MYRLLAFCARVECNNGDYKRLARQATSLLDWQEIPVQAETQGMAPLLYTHLKAAGVQLPLTVERQLQGLYLRHRHGNQVRARALRNVLVAFQATGIPTLVLKGAALSHFVYPEPALRPMSDLDILVPKADLLRAQRLLADLGFDAPLPSRATPPHRHLAAATLHSEGVLIQVEIHHKLFSNYSDHAISYLRSIFQRLSTRPNRDRPSSIALNGPAASPYPFTLMDLTAHTLEPADMLWYLCQHLASHINVWDTGRLIWVADIVSLAQRFATEIDWERVHRQYPVVLDTLSLLHFMTPLSEALLAQAGVKLGRTLQGIGIGYQGWPRVPKAEWQNRGYRRVLRDTLWPSEWWLRLRYKLGSARPLLWYRWVRHPLHLLGHIARVFLERLGWPTFLELAEP